MDTKKASRSGISVAVVAFGSFAVMALAVVGQLGHLRGVCGLAIVWCLPWAPLAGCGCVAGARRCNRCMFVGISGVCKMVQTVGWACVGLGRGRWSLGVDQREGETDGWGIGQW